MKIRYRLMSRGSRGNAFYCVDSMTGKRTSLGKTDRDSAEQIVHAKNQALRQPTLNLQIAKAYLAGSDSGVATRTWREALSALIETKTGPTKERWERAAKEVAISPLLPKIIIETRAEDLLEAILRGTVSTNVHLRKLHNYCLAMTWLPWPIIPKPQWPKIRFKEKRAITAEEHARVVAAEGNAERRAFYELCWHLGGSQSDVASLHAEDIDWTSCELSYARKKTGSRSLIRFGPDTAALLRSLSETGLLFPTISKAHEKHRAKEFKRRCKQLGIHGVTLHSYRYAWAERALKVGYPERFAQEALGHNSKAVHRAYAKRAEVSRPSLEIYEKQHKYNSALIPLRDVGGSNGSENEKALA